MSASDACEQGLLDLLFLNLDFANIGDAGGLQNSAVAGSLYVSLHTGDPGEAGTQTSSETTYVGYTRVAVARAAGGWTRTGSTINPTSVISFPACTSGTATITHFGIGTSPTGAGTLLFSGTVSPNIAVSAGVTPRLTTATAISCD